jgi:hypothetical protein
MFDPDTAGSFTLQANTSYWVIARAGPNSDNPSSNVNGMVALQNPTTTENGAALWYDDSGRPGIYDGNKPDASTWNAGNRSSYAVDFNVNAVIPEPATMSLLALGGLAVLCRRRR